MNKSLDVIIFQLEKDILPNMEKEMEKYPMESDKHAEIVRGYCKASIELVKLKQQQSQIRLREGMISVWAGTQSYDE